MRMRRFDSLASLLGEMLLYQHQGIVTTTKVYIAPFMSEDRSFDLSTAARYVLFIADRSCRKIGGPTSQLHYFMLLCTGSTPGKSVQAPIRL